MSTYLLLAGSFHAGWCWSGVASLLRDAGHNVHTPTLTGLGERAHLSRSDIGIEDHIEDIEQTIFFENLSDIIIVSHSYAGVVAGAVTNRLPHKFTRAVYFDSLIPENNASVVDLLPDGFDQYFTSRITSDGLIPLADDAFQRWGLTDEVDLQWARPRLTPQPAATFTDKLTLATPVETTGPSPVYIYATNKPGGDMFAPAAHRAKSTPGWTYKEIDAPHDYMITHPELTTHLLTALSD